MFEWDLNLESCLISVRTQGERDLLFCAVGKEKERKKGVMDG